MTQNNRIDQAVAQELIDAAEAYTAACEELVRAEFNDRDDGEAADGVNLECLIAQHRLEMAFAAATGWTATFHPAKYDRRDAVPVKAQPSEPPYWTIA